MRFIFFLHTALIANHYQLCYHLDNGFAGVDSGQTI